MVYFAQFNLKSDAIAMVTASHNENGWTGVKMGYSKRFDACARRNDRIKGHHIK